MKIHRVQIWTSWPIFPSFNLFTFLPSWAIVDKNLIQCTNSFLKEVLALVIRELKQPRRRRQQKPHKFAYLTMKHSIFARFARAFFIFDNEKHYFCTLCTCIFPLLTFCRLSRSFYDVKWPVLQLCGRREHMMTNQLCLLMSQALVPI